MKNKLIYGLVITALMSCGDRNSKTSDIETPSDKYAELNIQARAIFGVLPTVSKKLENPLTNEKIQLGKALYFDNRLSKDNTQSCNTCHNLNTYGVDNKSFSEGNDGELGGRNSPTTLNAAFHIAQFWDGREPDVEAQAGGPILNPIEMAMPNENAVIEKLSKIDEYKKLFSKAFPNEENAITYDNLKKAIGAFERKLVTPSKFDDYISGNDNALNEKELKGLQTFINSGCVTCHSGKLLGGNMFQKFGLFSNYWEHTKSKKIDEGIFEVTKNETDKYFFKVPSLRNIEKTAPYFHDGSINELSAAIKIMAKIQVNKDLTEKEISEIIDFLKTLTGNVPNELKE
ncbi:MAG: cytochrome-c peroxidase [Bacteroidetes bacterium]|nr:cytochrome-c peroxidase [Bacteroidota bacterium]